MGLRSRLKNLFKRKKKEADWEKKPRQPQKKTKSRKYRFGFIRPIKRIIAGGLLILHAGFTISIIQMNTLINKDYSVIFLLTSFILLDYLWKTRKFKIVYESS